MSDYQHNATILRQLERGDMLEFDRGMYSHWAVYIGDEQVIHLTGENDGLMDGLGNPSKSFTIAGKQFKKASVRVEGFWNVARGTKIKKNNLKDRKCRPSSPEEIIRRALSKVGRVGYNALWYNCEHFVSWCRYGKEWSEQADTLIAGVTLFSGIAAVVGFVVAMTSGKSKERDQEDTQ